MSISIRRGLKLGDSAMPPQRLIARSLGAVITVAVITACTSADSATSSAPTTHSSVETTASFPASSASAAPTTLASVPTTVVDDPDAGWQTRDRCQMTPILRSMDEAPPSVAGDLLAASPLAPYLEAARAGQRIPRVTLTAAQWYEVGPPGREVYLDSLQVAMWLNCPVMVRQILDLGVSPDGQLPDEADAPVMRAASLGEWDIVFLLLDAGADPYVVDSYEPWRNLLSESSDDPAVLNRVWSSMDPARPEVQAILDDGLGAALASAGEYPSADHTISVEHLVDWGARPTISGLIALATVSSDPSLFATVLDVAGQQPDLLELGDGAGTLCYLTDPSHGGLESFQSDYTDDYDPDRIQAIVDLATTYLSPGEPLCDRDAIDR